MRPMPASTPSGVPNALPPPPERAPWTPADILEWRDLSDDQRYRDLKTYARAADRSAGRKPQARAERLAA